jgi:hypothetical protein
MKRSPVRLFVLGSLALSASPAAAETFTGLCPDGSAFIVQNAEDAPCPHPKFVDASDLPPLRPDYLPKPYLWYVDQQLQSERNPYNLVDKAKALRELRAPVDPKAPAAERAGIAAQTAAPAGAGQAPALGLSQALPTQQPVALPAPMLDDAQLRDLTQLIGLRQQVAPAELLVSDAGGAEQLTIRFAYSPSSESLLRSALDGAEGHVIVYSVIANQPSEFRPNFLVAQNGATFRPDPEQSRESGLLLGSAGSLPQGQILIGYLVIPERFDLGQPLRVWLNDRDVELTLRAAGE